MSTDNQSFVNEFESLSEFSHEQLMLFAARGIAWRAVEHTPSWMEVGSRPRSEIEKLGLAEIRNVLERADEIDQAIRDFEAGLCMDDYFFLTPENHLVYTKAQLKVALEVFRAAHTQASGKEAAREMSLEGIDQLEWSELQALIEGGFTKEHVQSLATEILKRAYDGCEGAVNFLKKIGMKVDLTPTQPVDLFPAL